MGLGGTISSLLSSVGKLLPVVSEFVQAAPSSSSSPTVEGHQNQIEAELEALRRMLERIRATLYDAEGREIMDCNVKLWLKELKDITYDAEDVLDEYNYQVLRAQVHQARQSSQPDSRTRKLIQMPDGMFDQIKRIKDKFDEIEKHRKALCLSDDDGPRRCNSEQRIAQTSHLVLQSDIFGRDMEKEELITMLSSDCNDREVVYVVTIVGVGGLGKTTLAQLVYNDQRMKHRFDKFGWICVSEDFNVQRLTREAIESITGSTCGLENLSALQNKIIEEIRGKRVLLVLDDVWNENRSHWELFLRPFISTKEAKVLVTTRNESVAKIMQTVPTFKLKYMSQEQCWQLFKHYAYGDVNQNENSRFVELGIQILEKCGKLPLAIKSIASLLRHEMEEENWIDILHSEIWDSDKLCDYIFTPLQISYAHLPTYWKPCFVFCSLFPKDCTFTVEELVPLWISQGYIESNRNKSAYDIGREYAKQLWQRSFFEDSDEEIDFLDFHMVKFKLHDIVHDLARLKSANEFYSIETDEDPKFPQELYHLYARSPRHLKSLPSSNFAALRTLIIDQDIDQFLQDACYALNHDLPFDKIEITKARRLRALKLNRDFDRGTNFSICHLKHLRYLSLRDYYLPEYHSKVLFHSLYLLRNLRLRLCSIEEFPRNFGNLVSLEELDIDYCRKLARLPTQMGSLTNIQTLKICRTGISSLPPSLNRIIGNIQTMQVRLACRTIGWLKDLFNLKGTLFLESVSSMVSLADAECANLASMHNLDRLLLYWEEIFDDDVEDEDALHELVGHDMGYFPYYEGNSRVLLYLNGDRNPNFYDKDPLSLMVKLQPHRNLRELEISGYTGVAFPKWITGPITCESLERITIGNCKNLTFLSLSNRCKLNYLRVSACCSLQLLEIDSLPLLQDLEISSCSDLSSVSGMQKLNSLVKLSVRSCEKLEQLVMDTEPSVQNSLLGLDNLTSLRSLSIYRCPKLRALVDEPRPEETCEIRIELCPLLTGWCLYHKIPCDDIS